MIQVIANSVGGDSLQLEVEPLSSVQALKEKIYITWGIAPLFLSLISKVAVLPNDDFVGQHCEDGSITVTVVTSHEQVYANLLDSCLDKRLETLQTLTTMGPSDDQRLILAVSAHLEDANHSVRRAVVEAIASLGSPLG